MAAGKRRFAAGFMAGILAAPILFVAGLLAWYQIAKRDIESRLQPPVLPTTPADFDWTLQSLEGGAVPFSDFEGQVIFLTLWRPSCDTCRAELPFLQELYENLQDDHIAFLGVATEAGDEILDAMAEYGLTFPLYTYEGRLPEVYRTGIIPSTFIITAEGKIVHRSTGPFRWDDQSAIDYLRGLALNDRGVE